MAFANHHGWCQGLQGATHVRAGDLVAGTQPDRSSSYSRTRPRPSRRVASFIVFITLCILHAMECLTAVGLAANIIQFVEFSSRLLSEANEVYHSATGLSQEHVELQEVAEDLKKMVDLLVAPHEGDISQRGSSHFHPARMEINKIALAAKAVAEDLIAVTQRLKVADGSKKVWRSFRQALSTLWNKDKIEGLQRRLKALRNQLSVHILAYVRYDSSRR